MSAETKAIVLAMGTEEFEAFQEAYKAQFKQGERRTGLTPWVRGWAAGKSGAACPYNDDRTHTGSVTFSRARIRSWNRGKEAYSKWRSQ